jgi:hypothetical protein
MRSPPRGGTPDSIPGVDLNTTTVDVTWAYDALSDFPVTPDPFSIANSIAASIFVTNLLGGVQLKGDPTDDALRNAGAVLTGGLAGLAPTGQAFYITADPNDLALLEPLRLPVRIINAVTGSHLDTPHANAIQPAIKILVDIGYPDVVRNPDGTYYRTFATAGQPTPFLSVLPLGSPAAYLMVPGDDVRALIKGFEDQFPILAPTTSLTSRWRRRRSPVRRQ